MFWWWYKSTSPKGYTNVPLVLWLQGGPGGSSTGFGNFAEIGPLDQQLKPRNTTWLTTANLLFIDNPVGTGYSFVDSDKAYTTDVQQIAADLLTIFKAFIKINEELSTVPFYIFSESYGGKMTAAFSQVLYKAVQAGDIKCNFKGFAMGDSWISPVDSTYSWGPYLYANSLIDRTQLIALNETAKRIAALIKDGQWAKATDEWSLLEDEVENNTDGVNFYNIQKWGSSEQSNSKFSVRLTSFEHAVLRHLKPLHEDSLSKLMNGPIRKKLGCIPDNVTWGGQSGEVFTKQSGDFMKPVTDIVDSMIMGTPLKVVVYSGQLDLIVDNLGTEAWVYRLKIADQFSKAKKNAMEINGIPQAFAKIAKNFEYYYILAAGHMVPADNGPAALLMLKSIVGE
ncbi:retinoid-inducible serine carboxypeptidase-like isoform X2 [Babylonia areolata]